MFWALEHMFWVLERGGKYIFSKRLKGKAIPLQVWTGPEGSRRSRLPDFKTGPESSRSLRFPDFKTGPDGSRSLRLPDFKTGPDGSRRLRVPDFKTIGT
jgi:hypothetical protein